MISRRVIMSTGISFLTFQSRTPISTNSPMYRKELSVSSTHAARSLLSVPVN